MKMKQLDLCVRLNCTFDKLEKNIANILENA